MIDDLRRFLSEGKTLAKVEIGIAGIATVLLGASYWAGAPTYTELAQKLESLPGYEVTQAVQNAMPGRPVIVVGVNQGGIRDVVMEERVVAPFLGQAEAAEAPIMYRVEIEGGSVCATNALDETAGGIVSRERISKIDGWIPSLHVSEALRAIVTIHEIAHCGDPELTNDSLYGRAVSELYADAVAYTWMGSRVGGDHAFSEIAAVRIGAGRQAEYATELMLNELRRHIAISPKMTLGESLAEVNRVFDELKPHENAAIRAHWLDAVDLRLQLAKPGMESVFSNTSESREWATVGRVHRAQITREEYVTMATKVIHKTNEAVLCNGPLTAGVRAALRDQQASLATWQEQVGIISAGAPPKLALSSKVALPPGEVYRQIEEDLMKDIGSKQVSKTEVGAGL